jgi:hypothetical protein
MNKIKELKKAAKNPKPNLRDKSLIKEFAEERIKALSKIIEENNLIEKLENEIKSYNIPEDGEVDLDMFISAIRNLKIDFEKYDLIEIFNNFNKTKGNRVKYEDVLNALNSHNPSNYFIQPDPSYLRELETKIVNYEKKIKQMEIELFIKENGDNEVLAKNKEIELRAEELNKRIHSLEEEKNSNQNILSQVLKNNFLSGQGINVGTNDTAIKKLKNKIEAQEDQNVNNLKEFEVKIKEYENKFENLSKVVNKSINIEEYQTKIINLEADISNMKQKHREAEQVFQNEKSKFSEKLDKYKRNYNSINAKLEKCEKEKEKILKMKNINQNQLQALVNLEEVENLAKKLEDLERRYRDREEHYVKLCNNANIQQVNKEIENISKKFDEERKYYFSIISQKNNDLLIIKKEFEEMYKELEDLKINKRIK